MKQLTITSSFSVFKSAEELSQEIQSLVIKAIEIRKKAYAPYSNFKVGTALLLDNGEIVLGSNQENAAYPSGLCAERVAVFQAGSIFPEARIKAIVISAASENTQTTTPIPPCGACRQSIAEYEFKQNSSIEIYFMGESGEIYKSDSVHNLLPFSFNRTSL
jgi:cytidine deaminase